VILLGIAALLNDAASELILKYFGGVCVSGRRWPVRFHIYLDAPVSAARKTRRFEREPAKNTQPRRSRAGDHE
jgi:hypothetical protein